MPRKKKYRLLYCGDCKQEFLSVYKPHARYYCPLCGDWIEVRKIDDLWFERFYNKNRKWTEKEDATLIYGYRKGLSWEEIADSLEGRTANACRHRGQQLQKKGLLKMRKRGEKRIKSEKNDFSIWYV